MSLIKSFTHGNAKYEGTFVINDVTKKISGEGKITTYNNDIMDTYEGNLFNGKKVGSGTRTMEVGTYTVKHFMLDDKMTGHGVITCKNGNVYKGEINGFKINGIGTMTYFNGNCYDGEWVNGERHGIGSYKTALTGELIIAGWKNDVPTCRLDK